jgi:iron(III) transport system substrate-binding protein
MSQDSNRNPCPWDEFAQREIAGWLFQWLPIPVILILGTTLMFGLNSCRSPQPSVVVYCAQDQVYAEPLFKAFTEATGIRVLPIYDSEAVKTVGLANRLLAERENPRCDVFWGNEEMRTRQLASKGVFRETNGWSAFGYRSRRLVINTNQLSVSQVPQTLGSLIEPPWRGKVAMAYPQFGTTGAHLHALRQAWGAERWLAWCRAMVQNGTVLVDGNSTVVQLVGRGQAVLGLTDSDDIAAGIREGLPIAGFALPNDTLLIPNTVGIIRNAPHPEAAEQLRDFLLQASTAQRLVEVNALEGADPADFSVPPLQPNWDQILADLEAATTQLNEVFLR